MLACMAAFQAALGLAARGGQHVPARRGHGRDRSGAARPGARQCGGLPRRGDARDRAARARERVRRRGRPPVADLGAAGRRTRTPGRCARPGTRPTPRRLRCGSTSRVCPPRTIRSTTGRTLRRRARSRRCRAELRARRRCDRRCHPRLARAGDRLRRAARGASGLLPDDGARGRGRGRLPRRHGPRGARPRVSPAACCCTRCTPRAQRERRSRRCSRAGSATPSTGASATSRCAGSACGSEDTDAPSTLDAAC